MSAKRSPHDYTVWHPSSELLAKREKFRQGLSSASEPVLPSPSPTPSPNTQSPGATPLEKGKGGAELLFDPTRF